MHVGAPPHLQLAAQVLPRAPQPVEADGKGVAAAQERGRLVGVHAPNGAQQHLAKRRRRQLPKGVRSRSRCERRAGWLAPRQRQRQRQKCGRCAAAGRCTCPGAPPPALGRTCCALMVCTSTKASGSPVTCGARRFVSATTSLAMRTWRRADTTWTGGRPRGGQTQQRATSKAGRRKAPRLAGGVSRAMLHSPCSCNPHTYAHTHAAAPTSCMCVISASLSSRPLLVAAAIRNSPTSGVNSWGARERGGRGAGTRMLRAPSPHKHTPRSTTYQPRGAAHL